MAELADAMDLGSIGNPVQVRPLLSAPSVSVYKSFLKDRHFFIILSIEKTRRYDIIIQRQIGIYI